MISGSAPGSATVRNTCKRPAPKLRPTSKWIVLISSTPAIELIRIGKNTPVATMTIFEASPRPKISRMSGRIALFGIG